MFVNDLGYCNPKANLDALALGSSNLFIFKSSQGNYCIDSEYFANCDKANVGKYPFLAYHYDDPEQSGASQVKWFMDHNCHKTGLKAICLDFERERNINTGVVYPKDALTWHVKDTFQQFLSLGLPLVVYSRPSWVTDYCPSLWPWLKDKHLWMATYPEMRTWDEIALKKKGISLSWAELASRFNKIKPLTLSGYDICLHQFTGDTFVLPGSGVDWKGTGCTLDINYTPMTTAEFLAHIGVTQGIPATAKWPQVSAQEKDELLHKLAVKDGLFTD
jgi:hypothetical protein